MSECRLTRKEGEKKGLQKNLDVTLQSAEKCWSKSHPNNGKRGKDRDEEMK